MTLQPNLTDPFELLETDAKVVPILPKSRLDAMIDHAVTAKQIEAPQPKASSLRYGRKGWWTGGLATAACLILLLTLFPMNQTVVGCLYEGKLGFLFIGSALRMFSYYNCYFSFGLLQILRLRSEEAKKEPPIDYIPIRRWFPDLTSVLL